MRQNEYLWSKGLNQLVPQLVRPLGCSSHKLLITLVPLTDTGDPCGSVVECLTRNPGVLGSNRTGSSEFFHGSVLEQDASKPQPSTDETQERYE